MSYTLSYISIFFITAGLIFIGFFGEMFFKKTGFSEYIFLILIGILFGPIFKIFPYSIIVQILPYLSQLTLAMIMLELGMSFMIDDLLKEGASAVLRTLIYVTLSVVLTFIVFRYVFEWGSYSSFFLATVVGGETTTTVVPYLAKSLKEEDFFTNITLEASLNSVILIVLFTFGLNSFLQSVPFNIYGFENIVSSLVSQISIGIVIGFVAALVWIEFARHFWAEEFFYIATIGYTLALYAFLSFINGSAILGVLTLGIMLMNNKTFLNFFKTNSSEQIIDLQVNYIKMFQKEITFFLRTYFFFFIGLVFFIDKLFSILTYIYLGVLLIILLGDRYIAVKLSTKNKKYGKAYYVMMAQGLTPAVLASLALYYSLPMAHYIVTIASLIIISTNVITVAGWAKIAPSLSQQKQ
ncbi:MAG: cation:proton antiporter [Conexivisphaerales archaeon]|nr:cation:proton antiporter [Conexivisphaerales archaeon]